MGFLSCIRPGAVDQLRRSSRPWRRRRGSTHGQTLVEVGLVLPIFILSLIGIIEFGYWAAVNSAVHTASREGARFGSTVDDTGGTPNYLDCADIRAHVRDRVGPLITLSDGDISIGYDTNGTPGTELTCGGAGVDADDIDRWDRIEVEVEFTYEPVTPILGAMIGDQTITSIDRRSIVKCASC
jgi:Flp pilus assembly protein TadG